MKISSKIVIDIMIAIAISLVVNFSHLLLIFIDQDQTQQQPPNAQRHSNNNEVNTVRMEGIFSKSPDGHGYLLIEGGDSAYLSQSRIDRYALNDGDSLVTMVSITQSDSRKHDVVQNIIRRNGDLIAPYPTASPQKQSDFVPQLLYYFILSLLMIIVATAYTKNSIRKRAMYRLFLALIVALALYLCAPLISPRQRGQFIFNLLLRNKPIIDILVTLKWSFAVIVSILYSQIYILLSQRQNIMLENERLRSESINAQYNMLMSQINPHVLFNSLNSLAMLVRGGDVQRSLTYIDQLSYTFRYILQNRDSTLTTLSEEMSFAEAYIYLFKIRYADKLFFDIDIDPRYNSYMIPALSLQPLLDNAVKHNTILSSRPFHVSITVKDDTLIVSNLKFPKLEPEPSTGLGLENLSRRWELIAKQPISVEQDEKEFIVKLPLINPAK